MNEAKVGLNTLYALPECGYTAPDGKVFKEWLVEMNGLGPEVGHPGDLITVWANATVTAVWQKTFSPPDFLIPASTTTIEAEAFEGIAATVVLIPETRASIGDRAFRNCGQLTMIRIPADCTLGADVFDGCENVYVFGALGSDAERYCTEHMNCVFVEEARN